MSTSTNIVSRLNEQLYADQTNSWNVQYQNTKQLHTDRNITAQCNVLISVIQLELFPRGVSGYLVLAAGEQKSF